jgi:hypothetical protein
MDSIADPDPELTVLRAVHRDTHEVLAVGVPRMLRASLEELEVDLAEVVLHTSGGGRLADRAGWATAEVLGEASEPRNVLSDRHGRDAEQDRLNSLRSDDANGVRTEIAKASEAHWPTLARYGGHRDRWFLGRMEEPYEADGREARRGDLVLYVPTPEKKASPVMVYAVRAGADMALPTEAASGLVRVAEGWLEVETIGTPGAEANVKIEEAAGLADPREGCGVNVKVDGVVIGCAMRLGPVAFVASAYPTSLGAEYTVGASDTLDAAIGAVYREWEAGWARTP